MYQNKLRLISVILDNGHHELGFPSLYNTSLRCKQILLGYRPMSIFIQGRYKANTRQLMKCIITSASNHEKARTEHRPISKINVLLFSNTFDIFFQVMPPLYKHSVSTFTSGSVVFSWHAATVWDRMASWCQHFLHKSLDLILRNIFSQKLCPLSFLQDTENI